MKTAQVTGTGRGIGAVRSMGLPAVLAAAAMIAVPVAPVRGQCEGQWSVADGVPGTNDVVSALAVLPDGSVLAGGSFTMAGGQPANHIARFDPLNKSWSTLGLGVNGEVKSILVLSGGDVVVGGAFNQAGGQPAYSIARYRWATGDWSALGSGTSSFVLALAELPQGDLVAGGFFGHASDVPGTAYIARYHWDTDTWSPLGTGMSTYVTSLLVLADGDVIAGGGFTLAGGVPANHIARYSPGTNVWSALGLGVGNDVLSLVALPDGDLVAGGHFTTAGGSPARYVARYAPATNTWSTLGLGANNLVSAIALRGGDIVAGGYFSTAGDAVANHVARCNFNTNTWEALGTSPNDGTNDDVRAIAVLPGGDVIVGGDFTTAGGLPANHFARWSSGPLLSAQPAPGTECPLGTASFSIAASGTGVTTYDWQIETAPGDWLSLSSDPGSLPGGGSAFAQPANAPTVEIGVRNRMGGFKVRCEVSDDCGRRASEAATLSICIADFNCVGGVGLQDLFDYLRAWFARDPTADVNGYGSVSLQDLFDFLGAWFAGC